MTSGLRVLLTANLMMACATRSAPLPSLQATRGPVTRPCSGCQADERCGDDGVCVTDKLNAREAMDPQRLRADNESRVARVVRKQGIERGIYRSRGATIAMGSVLGAGAVVLALSAAEGASDTAGIGWVIGGVLAGVGAVGTIVAGTFLGLKQRELRAFTAEHPMALRVRPQLGLQGGHTRAGLALELRF